MPGLALPTRPKPAPEGRDPLLPCLEQAGSHVAERRAACAPCSPSPPSRSGCAPEPPKEWGRAPSPQVTRCSGGPPGPEAVLWSPAPPGGAPLLMLSTPAPGMGAASGAGSLGTGRVALPEAASSLPLPSPPAPGGWGGLVPPGLRQDQALGINGGSPCAPGSKPPDLIPCPKPLAWPQRAPKIPKKPRRAPKRGQKQPLPSGGERGEGRRPAGPHLLLPGALHPASVVQHGGSRGRGAGGGRSCPP